MVRPRSFPNPGIEFAEVYGRSEPSHRTNVFHIRGVPMASKADTERRNRLAYLALYYAIQGNDERSEQIRRMVRQMDPLSKSKRAAAIEEPVVV